MFGSLNFWKKHDEPNLREQVLASQKTLQKEIVDRNLKMIVEKHQINACQEQMEYLSTCMKHQEETVS
jgi:hypothetical protein